MKSFANQSSRDLWAITCYFNPSGYRRRLKNFRVFRKHLRVPLVAVELAYRPNFELDENDAEILLQLRGKDVLWQKERLLNVALQSLPKTCRKVAWCDCDVVFEADDWAERTSLLLDSFLLVQPYSHLHRMPKDWQLEHGWMSAAEVQRAVPSLIGSGMRATDCLSIASNRLKSSPGCVWAAAREVLKEHHLYDACIMGGGDSAMVRAAYGCFEAAIRSQHMNQRRKDHYLSWAQNFYNTVCANVTSIGGNLAHLWHGQLEHRCYHERLELLNRFQFDPFEDVAVDLNGAWRWNTTKRQFHDHVRAYFSARREDG
jgi:hypothetical protein